MPRLAALKFWNPKKHCISTSPRHDQSSAHPNHALNNKRILINNKNLTQNDNSMKRSSTIFLQVVIVLIGIGALALLLVEPHFEGRNVHATVFQIYFHDPFLAYAYTGSIAFFVALYQAFKLLGYVGRNEVFSQRSVKALRTIKYCGMTLVAFLVGAEAYFFTFQRGKGEDIAGGVMMGLVLIFISVVIATAAAVFERTLQSAVEMKSENDLTV
jgi:hypothetical protein